MISAVVQCLTYGGESFNEDEAGQLIVGTGLFESPIGLECLYKCGLSRRNDEDGGEVDDIPTS